MFSVIELVVHGKVKYEIVYKEGGKHVAYLNDRTEAQTLIRLLNSGRKK